MKLKFDEVTTAQFARFVELHPALVREEPQIGPDFYYYDLFISELPIALECEGSFGIRRDLLSECGVQ